MRQLWLESPFHYGHPLVASRVLKPLPQVRLYDNPDTRVGLWGVPWHEWKPAAYARMMATFLEQHEIDPADFGVDLANGLRLSCDIRETAGPRNAEVLRGLRDGRFTSHRDASKLGAIAGALADVGLTPAWAWFDAETYPSKWNALWEPITSSWVRSTGRRLGEVDAFSRQCLQVAATDLLNSVGWSRTQPVVAEVGAHSWDPSAPVEFTTVSPAWGPAAVDAALKMTSATKVMVFADLSVTPQQLGACEGTFRDFLARSA